MTVRIIIPAFLQPFTGGVDSAEVSGRTLEQCLDGLIKQFPNLGEKLYTDKGVLNKGINLFVNRERVNPGDLTASVDDGDEIHIAFTTVGG